MPTKKKATPAKKAKSSTAKTKKSTIKAKPAATKKKSTAASKKRAPAAKAKKTTATTKKAVKKPESKVKKTAAKTKKPATKTSKQTVAKKTATTKKTTATKKKATTTSKKPVVTKPKAKSTKKAATKQRASASGPLGVKPYKAKSSESYMNAKQLEHFEQILMLWKEQLLEEMGRTVQHIQDESANFPDPIDRASQEEGFSLELRTRDRERKLINKISMTLEEIKAGTYGYCHDCGAEIGIRRLEARPTAAQCIECKTIAEIREKQTGG